MTNAEREAAIGTLKTFVQQMRDFNEGWIARHEAQGDAKAAKRRREVVREVRTPRIGAMATSGHASWHGTKRTTDTGWNR